MSRRRPVMSIIGSGAGATTPEQDRLAEALGYAAIEAGFRVCCGGLGGVMTAVCRGARRAPTYREGDTLGIVPGNQHREANDHVDIVLPTGMGYARNVLVVLAGDVVVAVAGRSGTLSEMALAWQLDRPLIALAPAGGWAARLAGEHLDSRHPDPIHRADTVEEAVQIADRLWRAAQGSSAPPASPVGLLP